MIDSRIEKLHTAARRYCIERHFHWSQAYSELTKHGRERKGSRYTDEALRLFPRSNALSAILAEIETFTAKDFATLQDAKEIISMAGLLAENMFTSESQEPLAKQVMDEERKYGRIGRNTYGLHLLHELLWTIDAREHAIPTADEINSAMEQTAPFKIRRGKDFVILSPSAQ